MEVLKKDKQCSQAPHLLCHEEEYDAVWRHEFITVTTFSGVRVWRAEQHNNIPDTINKPDIVHL